MKRYISLLLAIFIFAAGFFSTGAAAEEPVMLTLSVTTVEDRFALTITDSGTQSNFYTVMVDDITDGCITEVFTGEFIYETQSYTPGKTYKISVIASGGVSEVTVSQDYYFALAVPEVLSVQQGKGYKLMFFAPYVDGYAIYRKAEDADEYALYKTTKKESLKIISSTADIYKIKSYKVVDGEKVYSEFSEKVVGVKYTDGKVNPQSAKSKYNGKLTVKWAKSGKNYSGWQVQYTSYDNFSYYTNVDVKGGNKTKVTIPVIGGLTYKVRVRGYKNISGSKAYTRWGSSKTVTVKSSVALKPNAVKLLNSIKLVPKKTSCVKLNKIVTKILKKYTKPDMTVAEKVRAAYLYVSNEKFSSYGITGNRSCSSLLELNALILLESRRGSCVQYNSLFTVLCNRIGIKNAYLCKGSVPRSGGGRTGHTWCMIKIRKYNYIFDPRMQKYTSNRNGYDYYCVPLHHDSTRAQEYRFLNAKEQLM
jgi:hypothetical protein